MEGFFPVTLGKNYASLAGKKAEMKCFFTRKSESVGKTR